jgi:hypothetical protein
LIFSLSAPDPSLLRETNFPGRKFERVKMHMHKPSLFPFFLLDQTLHVESMSYSIPAGVMGMPSLGSILEVSIFPWRYKHIPYYQI